MLNKLLAFIRKYDMVQPGDTVVCAVSGGADSMALLWGMYLLREKLQISLEAAHFNHHLRGEESDRDEAFVKDFCDGYHIPLHLGAACVTAGKKGLEAAAREARYDFLESLPGKVATAHTADDNAETVLMHMVRGSGLRGLGGITPVRGKLIRPLLSATREEICAFLAEYSISYVTDSSNEKDQFLRNRLRHHVVPSLKQENPGVSVALSAMALRLREDETVLEQLAKESLTEDVKTIRKMQPAIRSRVLAELLRTYGVREPEAEHIKLLEAVVNSDCPSASADFPGNITVGRVYGKIGIIQERSASHVVVPASGKLCLPDWGVEIESQPVEAGTDNPGMIVVQPAGDLVLRSRQKGDSIRLSGGTKSLKKLFIDMKIPASKRNQIPVIADDKGVLYVHGIGPNLHRVLQSGEGVGLYIRSL